MAAQVSTTPLLPPPLARQPKRPSAITGSNLQGYNCQLAVGSDHQVIVATGVSNQPPDVAHLEPMLQRIAASAGALPGGMTMDAGYWSVDNANACADQGIDAYNRCAEAKDYATGRLPHSQPPPRRSEGHYLGRMAPSAAVKDWGTPWSATG